MKAQVNQNPATAVTVPGTADCVGVDMEKLKCKVQGCDKPARKRGMCSAHYFRWWRRNGHHPNKTRPCQIAGCKRERRSPEYCEHHLIRIERYGDPFAELPSMLREGNDNWRGDEAGYNAAHDRVRAARGVASNHSCQLCTAQAAHWAYDHADPDEKIGLNHGRMLAYSLDPDHYMPLCVSCHRAFDTAARGNAPLH